MITDINKEDAHGQQHSFNRLVLYFNIPFLSYKMQCALEKALDQRVVNEGNQLVAYFDYTNEGFSVASPYSNPNQTSPYNYANAGNAGFNQPGNAGNVNYQGNANQGNAGFNQPGNAGNVNYQGNAGFNQPGNAGNVNYQGNANDNVAFNDSLNNAANVGSPNQPYRDSNAKPTQYNAAGSDDAQHNAGFPNDKGWNTAGSNNPLNKAGSLNAVVDRQAKVKEHIFARLKAAGFTPTAYKFISSDNHYNMHVPPTPYNDKEGTHNTTYSKERHADANVARLNWLKTKTEAERKDIFKVNPKLKEDYEAYFHGATPAFPEARQDHWEPEQKSPCAPEAKQDHGEPFKESQIQGEKIPYQNPHFVGKVTEPKPLQVE